MVFSFYFNQQSHFALKLLASLAHGHTQARQQFAARRQAACIL